MDDKAAPIIMKAESLADLIEGPIGLLGMGFKRTSPSRKAWDRVAGDDVVWRLLVDDSPRMSSVRACIVLPFFKTCKSMVPYMGPYSTWRGVLDYNAVGPIALINKTDAVFDMDHPRRGLLRAYPKGAVDQLQWLVESNALPFLERFPSLERVLEGMLHDYEKRFGEGGPGFYGEAEIALIRWRLQDVVGAKEAIERAARDARAADSDIAEEQMSFVAGVEAFIDSRSPMENIPPVMIWPDLDDRARQWLHGEWVEFREQDSDPSLMVQVYHGETAGVVYYPVVGGSGVAWVGSGPDEDGDEPYNVEQEVAGLSQWALAATGTVVDRERLGELIRLKDGDDLLLRLTDLCEVLGIGLPKD